MNAEPRAIPRTTQPKAGQHKTGEAKTAQAKATPWLEIVGVLPDGSVGPTTPAAALAREAVFGADRLLSVTSIPEANRRPWPKPFRDGIEAVLARRGQPTTVLASGDPLHFGVAATLLRRLEPAEVAVHPAPSAFSLAAALMRWPLEGVRTLSLHANPAVEIGVHLSPGVRLLVLTRDGSAPAAIAAELERRGFGDSTFAVLENLGTRQAARLDARARDIAGTFADLNVVAITAVGEAPVAANTLHHDGCITRDPVRLLTIDALGNGRGHLWDVGAGSGAVAIDFMRAGGTASLFEIDPARCEIIERNLSAEGRTAAVFPGNALEIIAHAATPDAIFMGGAVGDARLFEVLWAALRPGGVFVANAVTLEGEVANAERHGQHGGTLRRFSLSEASPVGRLMAMKPAMTVTQWRAVKPGGAP
ncbi:MAG: precorrin-6y C5,15-methyltransferase (decarboxylating) subunit CbiE [Pseudomonadota bacterium]